MGEDATEMRRRPQRAGEVGAELQRHETGGERGRGATRGAAGGARQVPWVVGGAVDIVKLCQSLSPFGTLVLPRMIAPAAFSRCTASSSSSGFQSLNFA